MRKVVSKRYFVSLYSLFFFFHQSEILISNFIFILHFIFVYSKINKFRNHFLLYRCFFIENIFYLICNIFNFLSKLHSNIPSPLIFSSNMISIFQKRSSFRAIFLPKEKKNQCDVSFLSFFFFTYRNEHRENASTPSPSPIV